MKIPSKLPDVGVTIFTIMSKLASDYNAINLSQGFPDFDVHPDLLALVDNYMRSGYNQYAPMQGVQTLRERIAEKVLELYHADYDPESEITVTSGATEALFAAISAVVQQRDEVIVLEPAFDSYVPVIELNGGIPVYVEYKFPDYRIDWNEVEKADVAWYKEIFEGDGTESWYAFMIPDTQSVVSRNSQGQVKTSDKESGE